MQKFYAALHATIWSRFAWPTLAAPERMELKINDLCPVSVRRFEADMMKNIEDMYTITYVLYIYICHMFDFVLLRLSEAALSAKSDQFHL